MQDLLGLAGKVAIVTGGAYGIGMATAKLFLDAGMRVVVADKDAGRSEALRARYASEGHDALVLQADVRLPADVARIISETEARFGGLDVLVNNVGDYLGYANDFQSSTEEQWQNLYEINLLHVFRMTQAALPLLKARGAGSIINLSTIEAFRGIPNFVVYSAFKAAITGFTQSLAVELGQHRIRVNAIGPESTDTLQVNATARVPQENREDMARWFPIGRFGTPEDSAGAALYFASDRLSGWTTGRTIVVDGGALAAGSWLRMRNDRWTHLPVIEADGYTPRPHARVED